MKRRNAAFMVYLLAFGLAWALPVFAGECSGEGGAPAEGEVADESGVGCVPWKDLDGKGGDVTPPKDGSVFDTGTQPVNGGADNYAGNGTPSNGGYSGSNEAPSNLSNYNSSYNGGSGNTVFDTGTSAVPYTNMGPGGYNGGAMQFVNGAVTNANMMMNFSNSFSGGGTFSGGGGGGGFSGGSGGGSYAGSGSHFNDTFNNAGGVSGNGVKTLPDYAPNSNGTYAGGNTAGNAPAFNNYNGAGSNNPGGTSQGYNTLPDNFQTNSANAAMTRSTGGGTVFDTGTSAVNSYGNNYNGINENFGSYGDGGSGASSANIQGAMDEYMAAHPAMEGTRGLQASDFNPMSSANADSNGVKLAGETVTRDISKMEGFSIRCEGDSCKAITTVQVCSNCNAELKEVQPEDMKENQTYFKEGDKYYTKADSNMMAGSGSGYEDPSMTPNPDKTMAETGNDSFERAGTGADDGGVRSDSQQADNGGPTRGISTPDAAPADSKDVAGAGLGDGGEKAGNVADQHVADAQSTLTKPSTGSTDGVANGVEGGKPGADKTADAGKGLLDKAGEFVKDALSVGQAQASDNPPAPTAADDPQSAQNQGAAFCDQAYGGGQAGSFSYNAGTDTCTRVSSNNDNSPPTNIPANNTPPAVQPETQQPTPPVENTETKPEGQAPDGKPNAPVIADKTSPAPSQATSTGGSTYNSSKPQTGAPTDSASEEPVIETAGGESKAGDQTAPQDNTQEATEDNTCATGNAADCALPKKEDKGFFGSLTDLLNPMGSAEAAPAKQQQPAPLPKEVEDKLAALATNAQSAMGAAMYFAPERAHMTKEQAIADIKRIANTPGSALNKLATPEQKKIVSDYYTSKGLTPEGYPKPDPKIAEAKAKAEADAKAKVEADAKAKRDAAAEADRQRAEEEARKTAEPVSEENPAAAESEPARTVTQNSAPAQSNPDTKWGDPNQTSLPPLNEMGEPIDQNKPTAAPDNVNKSAGVAPSAPMSGRITNAVQKAQSILARNVPGIDFNAINTKLGLPQGTAEVIAHIENSGKATGCTGSYCGLYQFSNKSIAAVGYSNPNDPNQSAAAFARNMQQNMNALSKALGRPVTGGEGYAAHQQGLAGAKALAANRDARAVDVLRQFHGANAYKAVAGNLPPEMRGRAGTITAGEFLDHWSNKVDVQVTGMTTQQLVSANMGSYSRGLVGSANAVVTTPNGVASVNVTVNAANGNIQASIRSVGTGLTNGIVSDANGNKGWMATSSKTGRTEFVSANNIQNGVPVGQHPDNRGGGFGAHRAAAGNLPSHGHQGVDWMSQKGAPVYAQTNGTVIAVGKGDGNMGNRVWIRGADGTVTTGYGHMDNISAGLTKGMQVRVGDQIGTVGNTGATWSQPHLHFETRVGGSGSSIGTAINPNTGLAQVYPTVNQQIAALDTTRTAGLTNGTMPAMGNVPTDAGIYGGTPMAYQGGNAANTQDFLTTPSMQTMHTLVGNATNLSLDSNVFSGNSMAGAGQITPNLAGGGAGVTNVAGPGGEGQPPAQLPTSVNLGSQATTKVQTTDPLGGSDRDAIVEQNRKDLGANMEFRPDNSAQPDSSKFSDNAGVDNSNVRDDTMKVVTDNKPGAPMQTPQQPQQPAAPQHDPNTPMASRPQYAPTAADGTYPKRTVLSDEYERPQASPMGSMMGGMPSFGGGASAAASRAGQPVAALPTPPVKKVDPAVLAELAKKYPNMSAMDLVNLANSMETNPAVKAAVDAKTIPTTATPQAVTPAPVAPAAPAPKPAAAAPAPQASAPLPSTIIYRPNTTKAAAVAKEPVKVNTQSPASGSSMAAKLKLAKGSAVNDLDEGTKNKAMKDVRKKVRTAAPLPDTTINKQHMNRMKVGDSAKTSRRHQAAADASNVRKNAKSSSITDPDASDEFDPDSITVPGIEDRSAPAPRKEPNVGDKPRNGRQASVRLNAIEPAAGGVHTGAASEYDRMQSFFASQRAN